MKIRVERGFGQNVRFGAPRVSCPLAQEKLGHDVLLYVTDKYAYKSIGKLKSHSYYILLSINFLNTVLDMASQNIVPILPQYLACWFGHRDNLPTIVLKSSFIFVRCFLLLRQYARCAHFIQSNRLHLQSRQFFYYLLYAQVEQSDWANAQTSLYDYEEGTIGNEFCDVFETRFLLEPF